MFAESIQYVLDANSLLCFTLSKAFLIYEACVNFAIHVTRPLNQHSKTKEGIPVSETTPKLKLRAADMFFYFGVNSVMNYLLEYFRDTSHSGTFSSLPLTEVFHLSSIHSFLFGVSLSNCLLWMIWW